MSSPSTSVEAADAPAPQSASEKAADFENYLFGEDEEEQDQPQDEEGAEEGEDLELEDDEQDDEADEPEAPAIDPPASLNAEEKEQFAQLPEEAQRAWAASENRRNQQVQEATTKAAERERAAQTAAEQAEAVAMRNYAAQLEQVGQAFVPEEPQRAWYPDDTSYLIALRSHDQQIAQHGAFMQQVAQIRAEADNATAQVDTAARVADLMSIGKIADPATRDDYIKSSLELVGELGMDPAAFEKVASSVDFKALEKVSEWKAKADKLDKAMARQMSKVRSAKGKSLRPTGGNHGKATTGAWDRVKNAGNKTAQANAMADFLESNGYL